MRIGVPSGTREASLTIASFGIRMQPCETRPGNNPGSLVP